MKTSVESKYALKMAQAKFIKNLDREMMNVVVFQMELIMLLALHDKFGYGKKRCQRAIDEFESIYALLGRHGGVNACYKKSYYNPFHNH